jgi:hypothetical protein
MTTIVVEFRGDLFTACKFHGLSQHMSVTLTFLFDGGSFMKHAIIRDLVDR